MIYLFNSAYNPTYFENVYRLVGLPRGTRVDMRYTEDINAPGVETDAKMKVLRDNGMTVGDPGAALRAGLEKIGATMTAEWAEKTGAEGAAILKAYGM